MSKLNSRVERQVRIELLRARAAVERRELCYISRQIGASVQPENIFALLKGQFSKNLGVHFGASKASGWIDFALSFGQRYPLLLSGASAVAGTVLGKKKWRFGALALTTWRLYSAYQSLQQRKKDRYVQADKPHSGRIIGPY